MALEAKPWTIWAEKHLAQHPFVNLDEFESELIRRFQHTFTATHTTNLKGKKRTRAENLTDHVKSSLTKRNLTRKLRLNGIWYLIYLPAWGQVGVEQFVKRATVLEILDAITENAQ